MTPTPPPLVRHKVQWCCDGKRGYVVTYTVRQVGARYVGTATDYSARVPRCLDTAPHTRPSDAMRAAMRLA